MKVSASELSALFDELMSGHRSREDVAAWASSAMHACDLGDLVFEPAADEMRIWKAITYLTGVDMKTSSTEYLHDETNFKEFRAKLSL